MKIYSFHCEDKDRFIKQIDQIHETEEEARRFLIYTLNCIHNYYPRKISLLSVEPWEPPFIFE